MWIFYHPFSWDFLRHNAENHTISERPHIRVTPK